MTAHFSLDFSVRARDRGPRSHACNMAFPEIAVYFSILLCLPGIIFMATGKVQVEHAFAGIPVLTGKPLAPEVGGFILHCLFILGCIAWCWGMVCTALAFGVMPAPAITTGATSLAVVLLFMAVKGTSITGLPGFYGPPIPARIIVGTIALVANANVITTLIEGGSAPVAFWIIYVLAIAVPQLFGAKLRAEGWMTSEKLSA